MRGRKSQQYNMENGLFLKSVWYFALPGDKLKKSRLYAKEILGKKIAFGRDDNGIPFALKDNCPHRGVPLSEGTFDGQIIRCCYHGWEFDCSGTCRKIPALADTSLKLRNIIAVATFDIGIQFWEYVRMRRR
jgi:phenylpropionate dioxygenase-like ring-hydroxylating dioxygenase large terminal subunit